MRDIKERLKALVTTLVFLQFDWVKENGKEVYRFRNSVVKVSDSFIELIYDKNLILRKLINGDLYYSFEGEEGLIKEGNIRNAVYMINKVRTDLRSSV